MQSDDRWHYLLMAFCVLRLLCRQQTIMCSVVGSAWRMYRTVSWPMCMCSGWLPDGRHFQECLFLMNAVDAVTMARVTAAVAVRCWHAAVACSLLLVLTLTLIYFSVPWQGFAPMLQDGHCCLLTCLCTTNTSACEDRVLGVLETISRAQFCDLGL